MDGFSPDMLLSLGAPRLHNSNDANSLATIIQRINLERGGFQNLTEESLQHEIAEKESTSEFAVKEESSGEEDGEGEEGEQDDDDDRAKELMNAKKDILGQIDSAHQSAMLALDFISLALTKDLPNQGGATLSQFVRDSIGTGTLGMDKLDTLRISKSQKDDDKHVAKGWKAQNLNRTVDSILASATRLEKEIELETRYWEQVLAVTENGWAVCRLPNEKHTLGVRFGFSESSPAFRNRSLGALRRNTDGSISLDQGLASSKPQAIRIRVFSDGTETGSTTPPSLMNEHAPIESLIHQARDTIFAQELWQELNRESRSLLSFSVASSSTDEQVSFSLSPTKTAVIDLVSLSVFASPFSDGGTDKSLAEAVQLALHLCLSWSHRMSHRRRTVPPPAISVTTATVKTEPLPLIRPILNRLTHNEMVSTLTTILSSLIRVLHAAGLKDASFTISPSTFPTSPKLPKAEQTLHHLLAYLEHIATVNISSETSITITARTNMNTLVSQFNVVLSPSSTLNETSPPPLAQQPFSGLNAIKQWLYWSTGCELAARFSSPPDADDNVAQGNDDIENDKWELSAQPNVLRRGERVLRFEVLSAKRHTGEGVKLRVTWEKGAIKTGKKDGRYEWMAWDERGGSEERARGSSAGKDGVGEKGEVMEVVRSLNDVVDGIVE